MNLLKWLFLLKDVNSTFLKHLLFQEIFENKGYQKVDFADVADVYVINTCSVTENADRECKRIVRKALNVSPNAFIIVIGCYAQLQPEQITEIDGVDMVLGASEKFKLTDYITDLTKKQETEIYSCEIGDAIFFTDAIFDR